MIDSALMALVLISEEALEVIGYNSFECIRDDLGKRLSW